MLFPTLDVFVDGGGNNRAGVDRYLQKMPPFHRIYVFEPNPLFHDEYDGKLTLLKKAIWVEDCTLPFYLSRDPNQVSSSVIKDKLCKVGSDFTSYHDDPIEVEAIDFSEWVRSNIKPNHRLVLKLDIEGAEYEVLWKMIRDGTIAAVKKLYVEFHNHVRAVSSSHHNALIAALKRHGVTPLYWD
jgi:FkbM family methyltransferase